jgi:cytochrome c553
MRVAVIVVVMAALGAGCEKNNKPPAPTSGRPNAKPESGPSNGGGHTVALQGGDGDQAHKMFQMMCAVCHGFDGTGNGPGAEMLNPKPRNYTDATWQASVTDDYLKKVILEGGAAVGKSGAMVGHPELKDQPETLDGLVTIIRGFAKK